MDKSLAVLQKSCLSIHSFLVENEKNMFFKKNGFN